MRPTGSAKSLELRRRKAIALLQAGLPPVEVARKLGVERRSVRLWKASFLKRGWEGIQAKPQPGRTPKLRLPARKRLEAILLRGAQAAGFATDLWTCPRIAHVIQDRFGVTYHVDHIGRLMRSLGWSPQKPQRRAVERDEEAIRGWIRTDWPREKKTRLDGKPI